MLSTLRSRIHLSPATAIATLALVFAMTGGAYAAKKYIITSTKQISPSVLKALKGASGKSGVNGTNGAQGPAGPAGAAGAGSAGKEGPKGETGKEGPKGETGNEGPEGNIGATLPPGVQETGTWLAPANFESEEKEGKEVVVPSIEEFASISFPIPLKRRPKTSCTSRWKTWKQAPSPRAATARRKNRWPKRATSACSKATFPIPLEELRSRNS